MLLGKVRLRCLLPRSETHRACTLGACVEAAPAGLDRRRSARTRRATALGRAGGNSTGGAHRGREKKKREAPLTVALFRESQSQSSGFHAESPHFFLAFLHVESQTRQGVSPPSPGLQIVPSACRRMELSAFLSGLLGISASFERQMSITQLLRYD